MSSAQKLKKNAEAAATQNTDALARALEEGTRRTIGQIDDILLSARELHSAQGAQFDFNVLFVIALMLPALIWRLLNEEKFLVKNLPGYAEYQKTVRHRLVPFLW